MSSPSAALVGVRACLARLLPKAEGPGPVPAQQGLEVDFEYMKLKDTQAASASAAGQSEAKCEAEGASAGEGEGEGFVVAQVGGCGGFGKGNFTELFKRIEDYERTLSIQK